MVVSDLITVTLPSAILSPSMAQTIDSIPHSLHGTRLNAGMGRVDPDIWFVTEIPGALGLSWAILSPQNAFGNSTTARGPRGSGRPEGAPDWAVSLIGLWLVVV